jgi:hypothetical protein
MSDAALEALILDLLEWIAMRERTYEEVMSAWRTSCPQLPVWEEANERGFVQSYIRDGVEWVGLNASGRALLESCRQNAAEQLAASGGSMLGLPSIPRRRPSSA